MMRSVSCQGLSNMKKIRDLLFVDSPYDGFDRSPYPVDMQGWGSDHPILTKAIEVVRPTRMVEVGSWKGRSAINMAKKIKALGLECELVCVDTWLGAPEHWLKLHPDLYASLKIVNGYPELFYTFLSNVVAHEVQDIITPFPQTSENAAKVFERIGAKFDIVYVDGAHEFEPVKRDLELYWNLVSDNGILIGDDYLIWSGVTQAANTFAKEKDLHLVAENGKFLLCKGRYSAMIGLGASLAAA
jgi:predicted O-methyltransferase YrrM